MPKLLRGSSLSSEVKGRAEGAGTAADCTNRAGDSSLELELESLEHRRELALLFSEVRKKCFLSKKL